VTFDAIRGDRFYILTHPKIMPAVATRLDEIVNQRSPTSPLIKPAAGPKPQA
jgi:hypothetical protein